MLVDRIVRSYLPMGRNFDLLENGKDQQLTCARRLEWFVLLTNLKNGENDDPGSPMVKVYYGNRLMGESVIVDSSVSGGFDWSEMHRNISGNLVALPGEPIKIIVNDRLPLIENNEGYAVHVYACIQELV